MGGEPPVDVVPSRVELMTRYLATLGLQDDLDVSLFSTFDYESRQSPFYFFPATLQLHDESNALVQFVVHPRKSIRDAQSALRSSLPLLGFVFGSSGTDPECPTIDDMGNPAIYEDHKVGGQPFFNHLERDSGAALDLLRNGYVHLLQIDYPSNLDTLFDGNWPFGEYTFHVFAKKTDGSFEFRYIWG